MTRYHGQQSIRELLQRWAHESHGAPVRVQDDWWAERWKEQPAGVGPMSLTVFKRRLARERRAVEKEKAKVQRVELNGVVRRLRRGGQRHD